MSNTLASPVSQLPSYVENSKCGQNLQILTEFAINCSNEILQHWRTFHAAWNILIDGFEHCKSSKIP